jgi:hypothetical protein
MSLLGLRPKRVPVPLTVQNNHNTTKETVAENCSAESQELARLGCCLAHCDCWLWGHDQSRGRLIIFVRPFVCAVHTRTDTDHDASRSKLVRFAQALATSGPAAAVTGLPRTGKYPKHPQSQPSFSVTTLQETHTCKIPSSNLHGACGALRISWRRWRRFLRLQVLILCPKRRRLRVS